ncbi:hypothetical protein B0J14DRAFT_604637 [Halenospora varia]|nr:hypothetical protein B0J14DRAFT_604637 [Halenospora varia]
MSNIPVEATEPDPAATSIANDQTVNNEGADRSAPTEANEVMADANGVNGEETSAAGAKVEESEKTFQATPPKTESSENGVADDKKEVKEEKDIKMADAEKGNRNYEHKDRKQFIKRENNSKYDPSSLPPDSEPKNIRGQVEFYFGDSNLPIDEFLWTQTDGSANKPVPIATILNFGRMRRYIPLGISAVAAALRESGFLKVTGDEGSEAVCRKTPYNPKYKENKSMPRSIYAKGFGEEEPSSQFDIEAFFAPYGPTNAVRLRRADDKSFKGSVFVEFQDEETAQKFLELDPKPLWKGKELLITSKKAYTDGKLLDIKEGRMEPKEYKGFRAPRDDDNRGRGRGGRGRGRGNRGVDRKDRGDRDPDDWKKRREEDRASGFKDRRGGRDRDNKNGRGGRGRRDNRGGRNDRNRDREDRGDKVKGEETDSKADFKTEDAKVDAKVESPVNEKKRAREVDDGANGAPEAKKIDTKTGPPVEAS